MHFILNRSKIYFKYRLWKTSKFSPTSNIFRSLNFGVRNNFFQETESRAKIGKPVYFKNKLYIHKIAKLCYSHKELYVYILFNLLSTDFI